MKRSTLLELDGLGNVLLGVPLLVSPNTVSTFLGISTTDATLYPIVLGAVFFGIGVALLVEPFTPSWSGLGLGGAMTINLVFGLTLIAWLLFGQAALLRLGTVVLWSLAVVLVVMSAAEVGAMRNRRRQMAEASPTR